MLHMLCLVVQTSAPLTVFVLITVVYVKKEVLVFFVKTLYVQTIVTMIKDMENVIMLVKLHNILFAFFVLLIWFYSSGVWKMYL